MLRIHSALTNSTLARLGVVALFVRLVLSYPWPGKTLDDFGSFYEAGRAASLGLNPYGTYALTGTVSIPGYFFFPNPNLDPPIFLSMFQIISHFRPFEAFQVWWLINVGLYIATIWLLMCIYPHHKNVITFLWVFFLVGFWETISLGQVYNALLLVLVIGWSLIQKAQRIPAGVAIGIVAAAKPNFLAWPALLFLSGCTTIALVAVGTTLVLSAIPILLYGPSIYLEWLGALNAEPARISFPTNVSLAGITAHAGAPWLGSIIAVAMLGGIALWAARYRPSPVAISGVALAASVLASPIAWDTYSLFLLPIFFHYRWTPATRVAAILLIIPDIVDNQLWRVSHPGLILVGLPYCLAVLLVAGILARDILDSWGDPPSRAPAPPKVLDPAGVGS